MVRRERVHLCQSYLRIKVKNRRSGNIESSKIDHGVLSRTIKGAWLKSGVRTGNWEVKEINKGEM